MSRRRLMLAVGGAALAAAPARAADPDADFSAALDFDLGISVPRDAERAFRLYRRAADAGLPMAALNLAAMYDSGRGVAADPQNAATYYAIAASKGVARAAFDLGQSYVQGLGVPRNRHLAAAWLRQAGKQGIGAAWGWLRHAQALPEDPPGPVTPAMRFPAADAHLAATSLGLAFVWAAAETERPSRYFLQVAALTGGPARTVLTLLTEMSAAATELGAAPGRYAWRVFATQQEIGAYAASPWTRFSIA